MAQKRSSIAANIAGAVPKENLFAHPYAPQREKPLDMTNRIVEQSSKSYISEISDTQFKHICIAFDRPYNNVTNTGGTVWICHLKYDYPRYSVRVGLDKEVMGQIQTLSAPFGTPVVRRITDMYIWDTVKQAAINVLLGLYLEGRRGQLDTMLGPLKTALDMIPNASDQADAEPWSMKLVVVINALQKDVFSSTDEDDCRCCRIL